MCSEGSIHVPTIQRQYGEEDDIAKGDEMSSSRKERHNIHKDLIERIFKKTINLCNRRKRVLPVIVVTLMFIIYMISKGMCRDHNERIQVVQPSLYERINYLRMPEVKGYLVWSENCKIPKHDPNSWELEELFRRQKYQACSTIKPLTRVNFNASSNKYILQINEDQVHQFTNSTRSLNCCYHVIERKSEGIKADTEITLRECISFRQPVLLANTTDNILVKCKSKNKQVYVNGHPMMPERSTIRKRLKDFHNTKKPVSVLLIGIDSISRGNLIRAMPKTAQYLYDNEWFEMRGYNKVIIKLQKTIYKIVLDWFILSSQTLQTGEATIGENTFPNLMAILMGYNASSAFGKCTPTKVGALDQCPFIWKDFQNNGYVTAYAEDATFINTFNYLKVGFEQPPVDYYLRPFLISAEKNLITIKKSTLIFCLGYQHAADYIFDYVIELATRYQGQPYFGLFWANSFSHNGISDCSSMDEKIVDYLRKFASSGILEESIVIFFSDHGMRFGPIANLYSGYLEDRLPFMFIWLPPGLKNSHPEFVNALSVNKNRLTNPYDIHMTLKHILELSGRVSDLPPAPDCPKCQTLLRPVPHSRSCDDAAIEDNWCTCI